MTQGTNQVAVQGGNAAHTTAAMAVQPSNGAIVKQPSKLDDLKKCFGNWRSVIKAILPKHIDVERVIKVATNAYLNNPDLFACTPLSMVKATAQCCELGLDPSPLLGECAFIARKMKVKVRDGNQWKEHEEMRVSLMPMYKGLCKLARQSGEVSDIYAVVVDECEAAIFEVHEGTERRIVHKRDIAGQTGRFFAIYGVVKFKDGTHHYEVLSKIDVDNARKRSQARSSSPWDTDYNAMACKTAIKRALKTCPMSAERPALPAAIQADNAVEMGEEFSSELTLAIDVEGEAVEAPSQPATPKTRSDIMADKLGATPHDPVTGEVADAKATKS